MERGNKKIVFKGEAGFAVSQCASSALKEEEEEGKKKVFTQKRVTESIPGF